MLNALVEQIITSANRDKKRFNSSDYEKNGEIFCQKCGRRKLARIRLPCSDFGKALDRDGTGFLTVVCECNCGRSNKEKEASKQEKIDYFWEHQPAENREFTADDDLPFE